MAFLFRGGQKKQSPADIAKSLKDLLRRLSESDKPNATLEDEVQKAMAAMKAIVQGSPGWTLCGLRESYD